jgi:hypothetical protein
MIVTSPRDFLTAYGDGSRFPPASRAVMEAALLVGPQGFRVSEESAADNRYMSRGTAVDLERACAQHLAVARKLTELAVPVILFPGVAGQDDGVYPNNVFATAAPPAAAGAARRKRFIVGAMRHAVRRAEAGRDDVRRFFTETLGYEICDLSCGDFVAELTGPLVLDRARRIGFCGLSNRADEEGARAMHDAFALELTFRFRLAPGEYHTNIVLAVLAGRACVLHAPSFADPAVPQAIGRVYPGRTVVLSDEEKAAFAGNCLAVTDRDVLFSQTAVRALSRASMAAIERAGFRLHGVEIDEIEKGGGSLRCLIAEVF